ncbi:MAG: hypothetical protein ACREC1_07140 [Methylovirgula sp.]
MKRLDLLKQMSFGSQIAEDEVNALASYFVETNQWQKIANGQIDIVRGDKGAGKSAIYALLTTRIDHFFDNGVLLVAAESPRGATVFADLAADPPTTEQEFVVLWKLYLLGIVAQQMREFDIRGTAAEKVYRALEDAQLLEKGFNLAGLLRSVHDYARRIIKAEALEGASRLTPLLECQTGLRGALF